MNSINTIFFDAVGTLFAVKGSVGQIYSQAAQHFGVTVASEALDLAFHQVFSATPAAAFPGSEPDQRLALERHWWYAVVEKTFLEAGQELSAFSDFAGYFNYVYDLFATQHPWLLYEDTLSALETLQTQSLCLCIISNFDSRLLQVLAALDLEHYFTHVTISTQVGAAKPDPQIFEYALAQLPTPIQALHVGDSRSQDYWGAKQSGLQALWLNRDGMTSEQIPVEHQVQSLLEVVAWLEEDSTGAP